jgi:hypothetical protein
MNNRPPTPLERQYAYLLTMTRIFRMCTARGLRSAPNNDNEAAA